jgi:tetratricopeptide (TPR) repeat protein
MSLVGFSMWRGGSEGSSGTEMEPVLLIAGPMVAAVAVVALPLVTTFMGILWPFVWVKRSLQAGDYERAVRRARLVGWLPVYRSISLFLEGSVLSFAGRWQEAESCIRQNLSRHDSALPTTNSWENLGIVLTGQQRYEEAIRAFEEAIKTDPENGGAYNSLAEVYLMQGIQAERAYHLTQRALDIKTYPGKKVYDRYQIGEMWANQAWALELMGSPAAADHALGRAFRDGEPAFKPTLAGIHFRAGQVMLLREEHSAAQQHFLKAIYIDQQGAYGQRARQAMRLN